MKGWDEQYLLKTTPRAAFKAKKEIGCCGMHCGLIKGSKKSISRLPACTSLSLSDQSDLEEVAAARAHESDILPHFWCLNIAKVYFLIPPSIRTPTATNCCCWCLLSCLPRIPGPAACLRFSYDPRTARCLRASPFQLGLNYFAGSSQHDWGVLIRKYMKTSKQ